jgi:sugar-specific transcriptional regulator TrmB
MNELIEILLSNGLKEREIRVYLVLLELGGARTGKICEKTKIASSNIYDILTSLKEKGLVNFTVKNNVKTFVASSPKMLDRLFLDKKEEVERDRKKALTLISKIEENFKIEGQDYKYFEGVKGIKAMWQELNKSIKKEDIIKIHTAKKESYENFVGFYDEHQKIRKQKKAKERMIFPEEDKELAKKRTEKDRVSIKFMNLINEAEWGIFGKIFYMQYISSKSPKGFLINDDIFARTFEQVFDSLWKQAKP